LPTDLETLLEQFADKLVTGGADDLLDLYAQGLISDRGKLSDDAWFAEMTAPRAHVLKKNAAPDPEYLAFVKHDKAANLQLAKQLGAKKYFERYRAWNEGDKPAKPAAKPKATAGNAWSAAGWSLQKQGECVKALGIVKASQIAKAAGCVIGSTHPNKDFN
jgi:hypothetical protein